MRYLVVLFCILKCLFAGSVPASQLNGLQSLYDSTDGNNWNWLPLAFGAIWNFSITNINPCTSNWQGIYCNPCFNLSTPCNIVSITLDNYRLVGELPLQISQLNFLSSLILPNNNIFDPLPSALGSITTLQELDLSFNKLDGSLPSFLSTLVQLTVLNLSHNKLKGSLPMSYAQLSLLQILSINVNNITGDLSVFGSMNKLISLDLSYNWLSGSFPVTFINITRLQVLNLVHNQISSFNMNLSPSVQKLHLDFNRMRSPFPEEFYRLSELQTFSCSVCGFNGSLPNAFYNLTNLKYFDLYFNGFSGSIPDSLYMMTGLTFLKISANWLHGSIISEIGSLRNLQVFNVTANRISGTLPSEICKLTALREFWANSNHLTSTLPSCLSEWTIEYFIVAANRLTGTVPSSLSTWNRVVVADFTANVFVGTLPDVYTAWTNVVLIDLSYNSLSGSVSSGIVFLSKLTYFSISSNYVTGNLDIGYDMIPQLIILDISSNMLIGTIPTSLISMSCLRFLGFGFNSFTGTIPSEVYSLPAITLLYLSENLLSGSISHSVSQLTLLQDFSVDGNFFTGTLPTQLSSKLTVIEVNNNFFTGELPSSFGLLTLLTEVLANYNFLTGTIPYSLNQCNFLSYLSLEYNSFTGTLPPFSIHKMNSLLLDANRLSGSLPSSIGNMTHLAYLQASKNHFTQNLPTVLNKLRILQVLSVRENDFDGSIDFLTGLRALHNIDITYNKFSGTFPCKLFTNLTNLASFSASVNCFHGSLCESICDAKYLSTLVVSGLSSASSCRTRFPLNKNVFVTEYIKGDIPNCLFVSNLTSLYVSGNGIFSRLDRVSSISPRLVNLSLSNNRLYGPIPNVIQQHPFIVLDLSYNRLSGVLDNHIMEGFRDGFTVGFHIAKGQIQRSLKLEVNRLSGNSPTSLTNSNVSVDILDGNLFQCIQYPHSTLPRTDPDSKEYVCGSESLESFLGLFGSVLSGVLLIGLAMYVVEVKTQGKAIWKCGVLLEICKTYIQKVLRMSYYNVDNELLFGLLENFRKFRFMCQLLTIFIVLINIPVFLGLKTKYATHTYEYGWSVGMALMQGKVPLVVVSVLLLLFFGLYMYVIYKISKPSESSNNKVTERFSSWSSGGGIGVIQRRETSRPSYFFARVSMIIIVNFVVIVSVNASYVWIKLSQTKSIVYFFTAFLTIFKLIWNPLIITLLDFLVKSPLTSFGLLVFNSIVIPVIVSMFVDSSCLYNLIIPTPDVENSYHTISCSNTRKGLDLVHVDCIQFLFNSHFQSPFVYSYQCSSTLLENYVPVYVLMYTIVGLFVPLFQYCLTVYLSELHQEHGWNHPTLRYMKDQLSVLCMASGGIISCCVMPLKIEVDIQSDSVLCYNIHYLCLNLSLAVLVMVTFGFTYPPLSVIILIYVIVSVFINQDALLRHYRQLSDNPTVAAAWMNIISAEVANTDKILFYFVLVYFIICGLFYSVFLVDIEVGLTSLYILWCGFGLFQIGILIRFYRTDKLQHVSYTVSSTKSFVFSEGIEFSTVKNAIHRP